MAHGEGESGAPVEQVGGYLLRHISVMCFSVR